MGCMALAVSMMRPVLIGMLYLERMEKFLVGLTGNTDFLISMGVMIPLST